MRPSYVTSVESIDFLHPSLATSLLWNKLILASMYICLYREAKTILRTGMPLCSPLLGLVIVCGMSDASPILYPTAGFS